MLVYLVTRNFDFSKSNGGGSAACSVTTSFPTFIFRLALSLNNGQTSLAANKPGFVARDPHYFYSERTVGFQTVKEDSFSSFRISYISYRSELPGINAVRMSLCAHENAFTSTFPVI